VEGVVHLLNELVPLVRRARDEGSGKPTLCDLTAALDHYEKKQRPHANLIVSMSGYITRYEAMETWWLRFLRWISPWISDRTKANGFVGYMKEGPCLNFLPNPDEVKETLPAESDLEMEESEKNKKTGVWSLGKASDLSIFLAQVLGAIVVAAAIPDSLDTFLFQVVSCR
jgi:hypothetical protein